MPSYSPQGGDYSKDLRNRIEQMEPSQSLLNIPVLEAPSAPTRSPQPRNIEPMINPTQRLREDPLTIPLAPPPPPIQPQPQPFSRRLRRRKPLIFPDTQLPPPQPQPQSHIVLHLQHLYHLHHNNNIP